MVKYGCDRLMAVIALPPHENKDNRVKRLDIGSTVGFKPTTLDDRIEILDIQPMMRFEPTTTQLKWGRPPDQS